MTARARRPLAPALLLLTMGGCAGPVAAPSPALAPADRDSAHVLAPSGVLRVGLYEGSPTSYLRRAGDAAGVGHDMGRSLAEALGVPFAPVVLRSNDAVLHALRGGTVDIAFTNMTPERQRQFRFAEPFMAVEKGVLVPARLAGRTMDQMLCPGMRIGVSQGSSTLMELRRAYPALHLLPVPSLAEAARLLRADQLDAFATNKAILHQLADDLPGARVLAGHWGMERFAAAIPRERGRALPALRRFMASAQARGIVAEAIARAGLRGTMADRPAGPRPRTACP